MKTDKRITNLQARHRRVYDAYEAVKHERIDLIKTLYSEGWTVNELLEAFQTTKPYLQRAIPEAFERTVPVFNNWE